MATTAAITYTPSTGVLLPLKNPDDANTENLQLAVSATYAAGQIVGEVTATPGIYATYASGATNGTQKPTHLLMYSCVTDASGNVYFGTTATSEWAQSQSYAPAYRNGYFSCADIVGLDTAAVTALGRLTEGTVSAGRIMVHGA